MAERPTTRRDTSLDRTSTRDAHIDLVIVSHRDDQFVVVDDAARPRCPRISLTRGRLGVETFAELVEAQARRDLGLQLTYLGVLSFDVTATAYEFSIAAAAETTETTRPELRAMSLTELRAARLAPELLERFELASQRRAAVENTANLGPRSRDAVERSLEFLHRHLSHEDDGKVGWSQYLDGKSVGALSTAQGLLAYAHAGQRDRADQRAVGTLETLQNDDGGWPVRRALIGQTSERSLTESTCFCLWALHEVGRASTADSVKRGIAWLETAQAEEGGWRPSAQGDVQVSATAAAVRTLSIFGSADTVRRGVEWLRRAQRDDGGWGETLAQRTAASGASSPAFTAHAVIALLAAGVVPTDRAVQAGCAYLRKTYRSDYAEPWPPTATNVVADETTGARLEFRHFATPWALAALSLVGDGFADPVVLAGTGKLLGLQEGNGAWRCRLTARTMPALWALHDALYALKAILTASTRDLAPAAMAQYWSTERVILHEAILGLLADQPRIQQPPVRWRWVRAWLSVLTAAIALLAASQFGLFEALRSSGLSGRLVAVVIAAVISTIGAVIPLVLVEEYRLWRMRLTSGINPHR